MSKPAARMGDTTSHGGAIMAGAPTVLIGGTPAARMGDMHTCPLVNPGVPPPPHVGGPVTMGSPTVLICGMMAARMGDMAQCSGPPDSIVGGCPTVLIGESGAGGGAGGGLTGAAASAAIAGNEPDSDDDHFLQVKFVDKAGNPVKGVNYKLKTPDRGEIDGTMSGQIKKTGIKEGNYDIQLIGIVDAKWSVSKAKVEDKIRLSAESFGIESGTTAVISIFLNDTNSSDKLYKVLETKVDNDKIETEWIFEYKEEEGDPDLGKTQLEKYSFPAFYFIVDSDGLRSRSGMLQMTDDLELELQDENGNPIKNESYKVYLSNGEIREGKLDEDGKAIIKDVPAKKNRVVYSNMLEAKKIPE